MQNFSTILPKLNNIIDTQDSTSKSTPFEHKYRYAYDYNPLLTTEHIQKKADDLQLTDVFRYLSTNENSMPSETSFKTTFYKKTNTNYCKLSHLKKKCVDPNEILEEVRQKFDFKMKLKVLSKKEDSVFNKTGTVSLSDNHNNHDHNINLTRCDYMNKTQFKTFENLNKQLTSHKNSRNVKSKYMGDMSNRSNDIIPNHTLITIMGSKEKVKTPMHKDLHQFLKVREMNNLLSHSSMAVLENFLLQNLIETLSETFPEQYEKLQHYFKYNTSTINSENKQIQMFVVALDEIIKTLSEVALEDEIELKFTSVLDSLYYDFCRHISQNSNHRSEFLKKIWNKRMEYIENMINNLKEKNEDNEIRIKGLLEDNKMLGEIVKKQDEEIGDLRIDIKVLNKENVNWLESAVEKDEKEKELNTRIEELENELQDLTLKHSELMNRFNARLNPKLRKLVFEDFNNNNFNKNNIGSTEDNGTHKIGLSKKNCSSNNLPLTNTLTKKFTMPINFKEPIEEEAVRNFTRRMSVIHRNTEKLSKNMKDNTDNTDNTDIRDQETPLTSLIKLDTKDLVNSRRQRNPLTSKTLKVKMAENKTETTIAPIKHPLRRRDTNILNFDKDILEALKSTKTGVDLYANKGIRMKNSCLIDGEAQTDVSGAQMDNALSAVTLQDIGKQSDHILFNLEMLNGLFQNINPNTDNIFSLSNIELEETKNIIDIIKNNHNQLSGDIFKIADERDLHLKENMLMKEEITKNSDNAENMLETYSEVFRIFVEYVKEVNDDIVSFLINQNQVNMAPATLGLLTSMLKRNSDTVDQKKISFMYNYHPKPEIVSSPDHVTKKTEKNVKFNFDQKNSIANQVDLNFSVYKEIYEEFYALQNHNKYKHLTVNMTEKKLINIIYIIYFDMIEKFYFKRDKNSFDSESHFKELPELLYIFLMQNFGLESLAKKKYLELLQAVNYFHPLSKRILMFSKLILFHGRESEITNYDNFVRRQLLLFIQAVKNNNIMIKNSDENHIVLLILYNKLNDIILHSLSKFAVNSEIKTKIHSFLENNKKGFCKNLKTYTVIDFDDLVEFFAEVLLEIKQIQSKILSSIFNAVEVEKKGGLSLLDLYMINHYIFNQKFTYEQIESHFKRYEGENNKNLTFEHFETICIEGDLLDDKWFSEYLKITDESKLIRVFKNMQEELFASALTVFDDLNKRLNVIRYNSNFQYLSTKISTIKQSILEHVLKQGYGIVYWIAVRIFDDMTLDIYNEFQMYKIFGSLEDKYKILEEVSNDKKHENLVIRFLREV